MKFQKIPPRPEYLIDFFEEGLASLGAVCERSWHDRLEVLAEGEAARLWRHEGGWFSGELRFRDGSSPEAGDPDTEIFPGCPLTFKLVDALWAHHMPHSRACLSTGSILKPPALDVAQKLWQAQFGPCADWSATPFLPAWIFSLVIAFERHTIHLLPHVDALLTVAEPALVSTVSCRAGRAERSVRATFVPRTRRWHGGTS